MPETVPPQAKPLPLVSVVIPTYQRPTFLGRAIESVLKQTYANWELLVIDDNDPESEARRETEAFMQRFKNDARIRYLKHECNKGGAAARNTGIEQARGEYVAFLDDDDEWLPEKLEAQLEAFHYAPNVTVVVTGRKIVNGDQIRHAYPAKQGIVFPHILGVNFVGPTTAVLCRKRALDQIGGFDAQLAAAQDWDLYIRLAQLGEFRSIPTTLMVYYEHKDIRITQNFDSKIAALNRIYLKYQSDYLKYPKERSRFAFEFGKRSLEFGYMHVAKEKFASALRADARNVRAPLYWLLASLGHQNYERLRKGSKPLRRAMKRYLKG